MQEFNFFKGLISALTIYLIIIGAIYICIKLI